MGDERIYQIALGLLEGIGPVKAKLLLSAVGDLTTVFKESKKNLSKIHGINSTLVQNLNRSQALKRAEKELTFIEKYNINVCYFKDPRYPQLLKNCPDSPVVLFTKGKVNFNKRNISIVGTRNATHYGKKMVQELIDSLQPYDVQIISGLARGIDYEAHQSALNNQLSTIGVLGHGLDTLYPAAHKQIAKKMLDEGGLVTEFISGLHGDPSNFPKRNRIVAGLSEATIVVESSITGGSMITARLAQDYNREVYAFPGNAMNENSKGCNELIKQQQAQLITSGEDIISFLNWEEKTQQVKTVDPVIESLDNNETQIVSAFKELGQLNLEKLASNTAIQTNQLLVHLFNLEMKGLVRSLPGKLYGLA